MELELLSVILATIGMGLIGVYVGQRFATGDMVKIYKDRLKNLEAMQAEDKAHYKTTLARLKREVAEYEQPPEMQRLAGDLDLSNLTPEMIDTIANQLMTTAKIPKYLRPFVDGFVSQLKQNPEAARKIISEFISSAGPKKQQREDTAVEML